MNTNSVWFILFLEIYKEKHNKMCILLKLIVSEENKIS